jgi:hypothetical protein
MTMKAEAANPDTTLRDAVNATLRSVTKHGGNVAWVAAIPAERRQGRRGRMLKQAPASVRCRNGAQTTECVAAGSQSSALNFRSRAWFGVDRETSLPGSS